MPSLGHITVFCFACSYAVALALEIVQLVRPRRIQRYLGIFFGTVGLLAHVLFLIFHPPVLVSQQGSFLVLALVLAVFYLYGTLHHRRLAWAVFVLPVVLALIALAELDSSGSEPSSWHSTFDSLRGERFWGILHGGLLLLAAVGVCVGFVASVMYLLQAYRLKTKVLPRPGMRLLSLERLEEMNRRAITLAFPLLTAGVCVGAILLMHRSDQLEGWSDPRIIGSCIVWAVFAILVYLRYGKRLRGRRVALLTIVAFVLLMFTLTSTHTAVPGGGR
jgi:ABC-type transport system involved in cytochrome c biogenesis permease subunit